MPNVGRREIMSSIAGITALSALSGCAPSAVKAATGPAKAAAPPARGLKYRGVVYDVGLNFGEGSFSVPELSEAHAAFDMRAIAQDLHCNAVRIEGERLDRLVFATRAAHAQGMTVLFNPWKINIGPDEARAFYVEAAKIAEGLRKEGVDIIFVPGCEYPIFQKGLFPGDTLVDRLAWLTSQFQAEPGSVGAEGPRKLPKSMTDKWPELNRILRSFVDAVRPEFKGPITYAATMMEDIDWSIFDIVGVDHYRSTETDEQYFAALDRYRVGKPILVMEVGCCTYKGAAARGGGGFLIHKGSNPDGTPIWEGGVAPTRSESEQADYLGTQLGLLSKAGIEGAFAFVFAAPFLPKGEGPNDMDMVSYSIVKTLPATDPRSKQLNRWEPKESYYRVGQVWGELERASGVSGV